MQVRDVLRSKSGRVITIETDATVAAAVERMVENNIGSLPVVEPQGRLVGIFSERDVLRGLHRHGEAFDHMRVEEVMTRDPVTCHPEDEVNDLMGQMTVRRIAKVPVTDDSRLVGIVSVGDVVKVLYDRVQTENQHLMSYIHGSA